MVAFEFRDIWCHCWELVRSIRRQLQALRCHSASRFQALWMRILVVQHGISIRVGSHRLSKLQKELQESFKVGNCRKRTVWRCDWHAPLYLLSNTYDHIDLGHSNNSQCKEEKARIWVNEHGYNSAPRDISLSNSWIWSRRLGYIYHSGFHMAVNRRWRDERGRSTSTWNVIKVFFWVEYMCLLVTCAFSVRMARLNQVHKIILGTASLLKHY